MKKIAKVIVASAFMLAPLAVVPAASATTYTCPIGYTGGGSDNTCVSDEKLVCDVVNSNEVTINNGNEQLSISGDGLNLDNTTTGSSTTGSATNNNSENFVVTVTNPSSEAESCVAQAVVPANVVPEVKPVTPTQEVKPAVLPNTSSDIFSKILTVTSFLLGLGAAGLFLGVTAYRLFQTK